MDTRERFQKHVDTSGDCWLWTAFKMKNGYGLFRMPDRHHLAHRISHELFNGPIPQGLDVRHSCDNPSCVNPKHLSIGTRKDNMGDARTRGRLAVGEKHGMARLKPEDVLYIFGAKEPQDNLAEKFGVSQTTISEIKNRKKWSHLTFSIER